MTQEQYIGEVTALIQMLNAARISNTLSIRPVRDFGTELRGMVHAKGFLLYPKIELFDFSANARITNAFRYKIFVPGWNDPENDEPVIRLQTDRKGHPINARFAGADPPHFPEELWPAYLKPPDITKAYRLFTKIVRNDGILPAPFGPGPE